MTGLWSALWGLSFGLAESYTIYIIKLAQESTSFACHSNHQYLSYSITIQMFWEWHTISRMGWIASDGVVPHSISVKGCAFLFIFILNKKADLGNTYLVSVYGSELWKPIALHWVMRHGTEMPELVPACHYDSHSKLHRGTCLVLWAK